MLRTLRALALPLAFALPLLVVFAAAPALAGLKAPVHGGQTVTVITGYNIPSPYRGYCNIGTGPDHCNNQKYGLDLDPSGSSTDILAPISGQIYWISGDCLGMKITGDNNLTVCHFSSVDVDLWENVSQGDKLGTRSTSWIHLSIDDRYRNAYGYKAPVPFTGSFTIEGHSFYVLAENIENYHKGTTLTSSN